MQLGLATNYLHDNYAFQLTSYGFAVFSILAPLTFVGLIFVIFLVVFVSNLLVAQNYRRTTIAAIDSSLVANTA